MRVSIDADGVGGPSAGLAFALGVLEKLGRNVDRGHKIAATGEIFLNGAVGPIGGIKQKTIGAREAGVDAFLVPAGENARDARKYAHGLRIIPVKSFQQALRALGNVARTATETSISALRKGAETARFLSWQALRGGGAVVGSTIGQRVTSTAFPLPRRAIGHA